MTSRAHAQGLLAAAAILLGAGAAQAQDDGVLARVDGVEITQQDVDMAEQDLGNALGALPEGERDEYLVTFLIDLKLLAKQAEEAGVAENDTFKNRLEYMREKALMEDYLNTEIEKEVTAEAVQAFYQEQVAGTGSQEEVRARHILVESEEEAKAIAEQLAGGADFAELAKEKTTDPSGKESGGDLGYFTKDQMVPEFAAAAFATEKGQISEPVKTQFGWHVLKVEDKREKQPPALAEVEDRVRAYLTRRAQADLITKLRGEATIEKTNAAPAETGSSTEAPAEGTAPAAEAVPAPAEGAATPPAPGATPPAQ